MLRKNHLIEFQAWSRPGRLIGLSSRSLQEPAFDMSSMVVPSLVDMARSKVSAADMKRDNLI